jgi:REase_DpnII-MboI
VKSQVVIEAKKARDNLRDREVGEQLIIDIDKYKGYPDARLKARRCTICSAG